MKVIKDILDIINKNNNFFIAGHIRPDGDCISSQLALAIFLKKMGKKVFVANTDNISRVYSFLPGIKQIKKVKKVYKKFDVGFFLDTSDLSRTGDIIDLTRQIKLVVNIDHHIDAVKFGDYNYIDPKASSTSEQIYHLIKKSHKKITQEEALCIYTGIVMDTMGFQQSNTTSITHKVVADLLKIGINPYYVNQKLYQNKSLSQLKLMGSVLSTLRTVYSGKIVFAQLTRQMYKKTKSSPEETEGFIEYIASIKGVKVVILFRETDQKDIIKVSLRSKDKIDINKIAKIFGGGGHKKAAGCTVIGTMISVQNVVLKAVKRELKNYGWGS